MTGIALPHIWEIARFIERELDDDDMRLPPIGGRAGNAIAGPSSSCIAPTRPGTDDLAAESESDVLQRYRLTQVVPSPIRNPLLSRASSRPCLPNPPVRSPIRARIRTGMDEWRRDQLQVYRDLRGRGDVIGGPNARAVDGNETRSEVDGLARGREGTVRERNLRDSQRRGLIIDSVEPDYSDAHHGIVRHSRPHPAFSPSRGFFSTLHRTISQEEFPIGITSDGAYSPPKWLTTDFERVTRPLVMRFLQGYGRGWDTFRPTAVMQRMGEKQFLQDPDFGGLVLTLAATAVASFGSPVGLPGRPTITRSALAIELLQDATSIKAVWGFRRRSGHDTMVTALLRSVVMNEVGEMTQAKSALHEGRAMLEIDQRVAPEDFNSVLWLNWSYILLQNYDAASRSPQSPVVPLIKTGGRTVFETITTPVSKDPDLLETFRDMDLNQKSAAVGVKMLEPVVSFAPCFLGLCPGIGCDRLDAFTALQVARYIAAPQVDQLGSTLNRFVETTVRGIRDVYHFAFSSQRACWWAVCDRHGYVSLGPAPHELSYRYALEIGVRFARNELTDMDQAYATDANGLVIGIIIKIYEPFLVAVARMTAADILLYEKETRCDVPNVGLLLFEVVRMWQGSRERFLQPLAKALWTTERMRKPIYRQYL